MNNIVLQDEQPQKYIGFIFLDEQPQKYIGYWRKNFFNFFDEYPFPIPNIKKLNQSDIIAKTMHVLNTFGRTNSYFGYSSCRICKKRNEYSEYSIHFNNSTYVIPSGYFHYLIYHNVKIDDTLVEIVNYYSTVKQHQYPNYLYI